MIVEAQTACRAFVDALNYQAERDGGEPDHQRIAALALGYGLFCHDDPQGAVFRVGRSSDPRRFEAIVARTPQLPQTRRWELFTIDGPPQLWTEIGGCAHRRSVYLQAHPDMAAVLYQRRYGVDPRRDRCERCHSVLSLETHLLRESPLPPAPEPSSRVVGAGALERWAQEGEQGRVA